MEVIGTLLKQKVSGNIRWDWEEIHIPINPPVVVISIKELYLLKGFWAGGVTKDGRMHNQEQIQSSGSSFLGSYYQEFW